MDKRCTWTERQEFLLKKYYSYFSNKEIATTLQKSVRAVREKARKMGLKNKHFWTKKDEKYVLKSWVNNHPEEIGIKLNRTKWAVINKYRELTNKR